MILYANELTLTTMLTVELGSAEVVRAQPLLSPRILTARKYPHAGSHGMGSA